MSLSGAAQRWFASVEPSRLRTWEDVAREFLTSSLSVPILTYLDESWRPLDRGQMSLFLPLSLVGGRRWLDLRSLVHAAFSVEEAMARGLWTDTPSPDTYRPPTVRAPFSLPQYQYQRIMLRSLTLLRLACSHDPHPRAATHPPP
ncbi:hypothetical protein CK203_080384 [Vitis vinifera]|uniref:Retrotransposon gag domain-containing protein n=1 Tax=Vitis vinifera TaxID=29760 RepID=A0A438F206_VITVI|nr:hypothetical protein CK203_080384 [Vitis vinifera]